MFRRSRTDASADPAPTAGTAATGATAYGKKPTATPKRREAEAAARARAKQSARGATSRREVRAQRAERSRDIRDAIKRGDERYLPKRDQGPVRRFVRDYVDHRLCMAELGIPLLFASFLLSASGYVGLGNTLLNMTLLLIVVDSLLLRWRLRREVERRFPGEPLKGLTVYLLVRALQLRFLRIPKPRVRLGQPLPDRY